MKFLIDNADLGKIKNIYEYYPVDGVTTNPSILAATGRNPFEVLREIRRFIGSDAELHVQVISRTAEQMAEEGLRIVNEFGSGTFVKIPAIPEGLKAIRLLASQGISVTATAVYTPAQAFLAGKAGADYVAPYVNRIDNLGYDGVSVTTCIQDLLSKNELKTDVLAASFKNSLQVLELLKYGVGAVTLAPDVIEGLLRNASVDNAVAAFISDFESLCGKGKTMLDCN